MPFQIRPAQHGDPRVIAHVHIESWRTTYRGIIPAAYMASLKEEDGEQKWQQRLELKTDEIFVCYGQSDDQSGIFGFINGGPIREAIGSYDAELYAIYLLQQYQQQGAGRALVRALAASLHNRGFQSMIVWVLDANPAVGFYKHLGAVPLTTKTINIGGVDLPEVALGWPSLIPLL
jgi:ribosomal protein S18 acetylase RimI-like enzyme